VAENDRNAGRGQPEPGSDFVDVSDRHEVEQLLRRSHEQLQQQKRLIDLSRDPIFVWDFDGGIVDWNRGSEELYGFTRDEAFGKSKEELLGTTVPGSSFAALKAKLLEEGNWAGELRQKTKSGNELTVESRLQLENFNGRRLVLESTRDVTARRASERRLRLLLSELTHRVRNTLAVIQAIARHTMRNSTSKEDFGERFEARLSALANAHSLLVSSDWEGADFAELSRQQLAPYIADNPDRLRLDGPAVSLTPDLATPFGLVLHELATDAAKYGSLSVGTGSVSLSWTIAPRDQQRIFKVVWQESGPPATAEQRTTGLGSALIDRVIPGASVEREFRLDGLVCTMELPLPVADEDAGVPSQSGI
jgi:two-component system CheB/CheR fusion protein